MAISNIVNRLNQLEEDNKKCPIRLTDEGYRKVIQEAQDDVMGNIKELRKRNSEMITKINQLEQKNEEWQRAYQEEKDKQFELLRENKQLEEDNEQLETIKDEAIRRYNFETIPVSKVKEKIEEYDKQRIKMEKDDIGIGFTLGKEWSDLKAKIEVLQELLREE